jgi:hypothetical protein
MWLLLCGVLSSVVLGCLGLYPDGLSTCLLVGSPLEGQGMLWFGKLSLFAPFGAYGEKETRGTLRIWKIPWKKFYHRSTLLCTFGLQLMSILCLLLLLTFSLAFLFLIRCFFVYSQCTKGRLTLLTYQNKKNYAFIFRSYDKITSNT